MVVPASADSATIISDSSFVVYDPLASYAPLGDAAWGSPVSTVATWKHPSWPLISGSSAYWISNTYLAEGDLTQSSWRLFRKTVTLCNGAHDISGTLQVDSDNAEEVYVNEVLLGTDEEVQGPFVDNQEWRTIISYPFNVNPTDTVVFDFIVRNYAHINDPYQNPTGLLFEATLDYTCGSIEVNIDIKPNSYPSCFNNNGNGVIPVAILDSADFDVSNVDVGTVQLECLSVAVRGKDNHLQASYDDVNQDGYMDLVVQIVDVAGTFPKGDGFATLTGNLLDGTPFSGEGDICITQ